MSTKFPASVVLMELASYMRKMILRTVVERAPREGNKEADKLANGNTEDFDPSLRSTLTPARCVGTFFQKGQGEQRNDNLRKHENEILSQTGLGRRRDENQKSVCG